MKAVEVFELTKIYTTGFGKQTVRALNNFSIEVEDETIYGLLGPNGAGKTTLVKILLGITNLSTGSAKILGQNVSDYTIRKETGYLPENHRFPPYLSAEEVLKFVAELNGINPKSINSKIDELLEMVNMTKWKKAKVKTYSKGMMQRLGLAQSLINDPKLVFLDEPTDGVDPIGRKEIRDILARLKAEGKTIFINSHLLSEVELISDKVAILNKGNLIKEGSVDELTTSKEIYKLSFDGNVLESDIIDISSKYHLESQSENIFTAKLENSEQLNELIDALRKKKILIKSLLPQKNTLEDMFISLINESDKEVKNG